MVSVGLWRWYINITTTILDISHRSVFCLKYNVSVTGFCLRLLVAPTQLGPTDWANLYLWRTFWFVLCSFSFVIDAFAGVRGEKHASESPVIWNNQFNVSKSLLGTYSYSAVQEISMILWNSNAYYHVCKNLPSILSQRNTVHTLTNLHLKALVMLSFHLRTGLHFDLFPSGVSTKTLYTNFCLSHGTCLAHLILLRLTIGNHYKWEWCPRWRLRQKLVSTGCSSKAITNILLSNPREVQAIYEFLSAVLRLWSTSSYLREAHRLQITGSKYFSETCRVRRDESWKIRLLRY
jgi:hypothetical protein